MERHTAEEAAAGRSPRQEEVVAVGAASLDLVVAAAEAVERPTFNPS